MYVVYISAYIIEFYLYLKLRFPISQPNIKKISVFKLTCNKNSSLYLAILKEENIVVAENFAQKFIGFQNKSISYATPLFGEPRPLRCE